MGDIVTAVNGHSVDTVSELSALLDSVGIGKTATLTVVRNGESRSVDIQVADVSPVALGR